ncbi:hypothetical protein [Phenylobacterium sp.]
MDGRIKPDHDDAEAARPPSSFEALLTQGAQGEGGLWRFSL